MSENSRLALSVCLSLFAVPAIAQDTARISPVVVSATRVPMTKGSLPVAVTVITRDQLLLRGITSVADALTDVTSAYVAQSGSEGAQSSLFLRGGESKYVKVLIDGVPVNDPGGAYDFASLTTDNVERIEIVRGPASVLYGADAVTGVVQIITRRALGPQRLDIELRGGSAPRDRAVANAPDPDHVSSSDISATLSGMRGIANYNVGVARHASNGLYQVNNQYRNNVFTSRLGFAPLSGTDIRVSARYTDFRYDYPTAGGGTPDVYTDYDTNAFRTDERITIGAEVDQRVLSTLRATLAFNSSVAVGGTDDQIDQPGGNSFIAADRTRRRGGELRLQYIPGTIAALTVGAQVEQQDQRSHSDGAFGTFTFTSDFQAFRRNTGGYSELVLTPLANVTATLGGRIDDNEQFGTFRTGRVGLSWRPLTATRFRATVGTAFREPTFSENYATGFVTGNPDLQPERTRSYDIGVEQELLTGRARVELTWFAQRFTNMIDYTGSTAACGYSYCNVAAARSNGVEAEVESRLVGDVYGGVGATVLHTKVLSPGFDQTTGGLYRAGETLIRRPEHKTNLDLSYRGRGRLTGSVRWLWTGERTDRDFRPFPATPVVLPAYQRIDVGADYTLVRSAIGRSSLTLRIENLQNTGYQSVFNFLAPRRTISLGARSSL